MQNETDIKAALNSIIQAEGDRFEYDEAEINKESQKLRGENATLGIKILSILGGTLSALAFVGFLMIAGLYNSEGGMIVTGFLFMGAALWLNTQFEKLILDTLSVTAYLIGLCLIGIGLSHSNMDDNTLSILLIVISIGALAITQNYILSFISVMVISGSVLFMIIDNHYFGAIHIYNACVLLALTYNILNEAAWIKASKIISRLYNPVRIGLIFALVSGLILVSKRGLFDYSFTQLWITSVFTIPVTMYVIYAILKQNGVKALRSKIFIYVLSTLCLLPTVYCPAISGSLLIILLAYMANYKLGLSIGILSFIYFVSQYYYDLGLTLLEKSIVLFASGVLFLAFFLISYKKLRSNEEV
jgi:hypothetical protein